MLGHNPGTPGTGSCGTLPTSDGGAVEGRPEDQERQDEIGRAWQETREEEPDKDEGKGEKRRMLKDIEKETLQEQDPAKLGKLFKEYRVEYQKREAEKGEQGVE